MADDTCAFCGATQPGLLERYRGRACATCKQKATCTAHGRVVEGWNTSPVPPWFWVEHVDDKSRCDEATRGGVVEVDGTAGLMVEGRFGGVFVMPA